MKKLKGPICLFLVLVLCLGIAGTALADQGGGYTITIENAVSGKTYRAYKIFDATYNSDGGVAYTISLDSPWYDTVVNAQFTYTAPGAIDETTAYVFDLGPEISDQSGTRSWCSVTKDERASATVVTTVFHDAVSYDEDGVAKSGDERLEPAATGTGQGARGTMTVSEPGYYFVTTNTGSVVSLTSVAPDATILDKNQVPAGSSFHKYFEEDEGETDREDEAMGDETTFAITSYVPLYDGDKVVHQYSIQDEMSDGLRLTVEDQYVTKDGAGSYVLTDEGLNDWISLTNAGHETGSFTQQVSGAELVLSDPQPGADGGYTASGFTLTYSTYDTQAYGDGIFDTSAYPVDATIFIRYPAYVTDAAVYDNQNIATIQWYVTDRDDPDPLGTPVPGEGSGQTSTDYVYTWELEVMKYELGTDKALEGAVFTLQGEALNHVKVSSVFVYTLKADAAEDGGYGTTEYYRLTSGDYITTAPEADKTGAYDYADPAGPYLRKVEEQVEVVGGDGDHTAQGVTDAQGRVTFEGLTEGTYTLTEIQAPDGYNVLDEPIVFHVKWDAEDGFHMEAVEREGLEEGSFRQESTHDVLTLQVYDAAGEILPTTGGIGTTIFYIIGGVLVAGAVVLLITRRRMREER